MDAGAARTVKVKDFGRGGLRLACREGSVDERAVAPWADIDRRRPGRYRPPADGTILDIGAHIGGFALSAARLVPEGTVHAVEASRESYELLLRNMELNGLTNVRPAHLALADRDGEARLHHDPRGNWGHTTQLPPEGEVESEVVPTRTLAAYLRESGIEHCHFAKLNCEGSEFPILLGAATETLRAIERMLVFYHLDLVGERYELSALERRLEAAGFELERDETGPQRGRIAARRAER